MPLSHGAVLHFVRCAGCGEVQSDVKVHASPARLEETPIFVLCEPCYVAIRTGYQRDRDRRMSPARSYLNDLKDLDLNG